MKKFVLLTFVLLALCATSFAQGSPFEWQVGDDLKIKLGGYIRFNVNADVDGSVGSKNDFQPSNIPTSTDWGDEDYLNFDVTASRLSLEIVQSTDALGDVKIFVEGDFRGTGNTMRLRQAYIDMKGFIAGYAWSFMSDLAASAPTIDITGVNSRTFLRTQMLGYRTSLCETLTAGISLEVPSLTTSYIDGACDLNQRVPNIPFYIQHKSSLGHIKVGGMIRTMQYGAEASEERESVIGWGAQVSGSLNVNGVKFFAQGIYGEGINNYINDISSLPINLMSTDGVTLESTPMGGFSLGGSYKISDNVTFAASGSIVENFGDEEYFAGQYKSSSYFAATLLYTPAPRITLGLEGLDGSRTNFGGDATKASRFTVMVKYTL
ncbi:MAG: DcaP family trimeric outer membrane transporter [Rikenellaceae bacterium]